MRVEVDRFLGWAVLLRHPEDPRGYPNDHYWHEPTRQWTSLKHATLYHNGTEAAKLAATMAARNPGQAGSAVRIYEMVEETICAR